MFQMMMHYNEASKEWYFRDETPEVMGHESDLLRVEYNDRGYWILFYPDDKHEAQLKLLEACKHDLIWKQTQLSKMTTQLQTFTAQVIQAQKEEDDGSKNITEASDSASSYGFGPNPA